MSKGLFLRGAMVAVVGLLATACGSSDSSGSGGAGGDDTSTTANAGGATGVTSAAQTATGQTTAGPTTTSSGPTTTTGGPTTTTGGGTDDICGSGLTVGDPAINECLGNACCDEFQVCTSNGADVDSCIACFNGGGGALCDDALSCADSSGCFEGGNFAGICDSGLGFNEPDEETAAYAECLTDNCCEEFMFCTSDGNDVQGCIDCLNGDAANYDLCIGANDCSEANCDSGLIFVAVCDSGLGLSNVSVGTCLDENCCDEFVACTGDGSDDAIQACIDCFNAENGGALCDAAIACEAENCNTAICDSGLVVGDVEYAACLSEFCCTEFTACTGDGSDAGVQACIDCFNTDGGGALCDDAIACDDTNCTVQ